MFKTNIKYLNNSNIYVSELKIISDFILENDLSTISDGVHKIDEQNYCVVLSYENNFNDIIESHVEFLDVHLIVEGDELMHFGDSHDCILSSLYNEDTESALYRGKLAHSIHLTSNDIIILEPSDIHHTRLPLTSKNSKKVIFKLKKN